MEKYYKRDRDNGVWATKICSSDTDDVTFIMGDDWVETDLEEVTKISVERHERFKYLGIPTRENRIVVEESVDKDIYIMGILTSGAASLGIEI